MKQNARFENKERRTGGRANFKQKVVGVNPGHTGEATVSLCAFTCTHRTRL